MRDGIGKGNAAIACHWSTGKLAKKMPERKKAPARRKAKSAESKPAA